MTKRIFNLRNVIAAAICLAGLTASVSAWAQSSGFNKLFGGSQDDYVNDNASFGHLDYRNIKLAADGTIWVCGSTESNDGDLAVPGNKGDVDAWLLNIDPATGQIKYNRTFGGTRFDEFCSLLLMGDGTVWVCGSTTSADGDLTVAGNKDNADGWVMHINPVTDQVLYNRTIGGSGEDLFYNIAISNNTIYLCGESASAFGDNTDNGFHSSTSGSGTDAWLVGINSTQNESAALTYNRCFGGVQADGFFTMQPMIDGTLWCAGGARSTDGDIAAATIGNHGAAGKADAWLMHIDPTQASAAQILYNCCYGGTSDESFTDVNVLNNNTIWLCGSAASNDGNLATAGNHGNTDVWLACVDSTTSTLTYNRCFGGSGVDARYYSTHMQFAADGTIWIAAQSASTDGDLATAGNHGGNDVWLFNVDPVTNQIKYSKCYGGSGDEIMPSLALDPAHGYIWIVAGTTSSASGNVPASHGGVDLWLFNSDIATGISDVEIQTLQIYPNPVKDELTIENYGTGIDNLTITDLSGRIVMVVGAGLKPALTGETTTINVSSLPSGVYFIKVGNNTGKFVKN